MTTLTLLVRASHSAQLKQVDELLKSQFEDLDVEMKVLGNTVNRWVQVSVSGEDEGVAASYIKKKIGTCPTSLENVENSSVLKGYILKFDDNRQELNVDVGVFEPKVTPAAISLARLQTQLANGKEVPLKKIAEIHGLAEGLPITIKVVGFVENEGVLEAELSAAHVERLHAWQQSLLDRLIILGASKETVESVLERTRLSRDVINVDALGLFEHVLTCKLGTDAAGVIPKIGRYLRNSVFVVFNARKSIGFTR
jgi:hypothetical protein